MLFPQNHYYPTIILFVSVLDKMSAIVGALGSVIGYLGGEVAEVTVFERLLWPQRYYNHLDFHNVLTTFALFPMGGPLHSAALKTLDKFRDNGLYSNYFQGHLLGTAFYANQKMQYYHRSGPLPTEAREVRNGFWPEVLHRVRPKTSPTAVLADAEKLPLNEQPPRRARQVVYHLQLSDPLEKEPSSNTVMVKEDALTWQVIAGVLTSELITIGLAIFIFVSQQLIWLGVYLCIPLLLKVCALVCSVRREPLAKNDAQDPAASSTEMYEIQTGERDFMIIEGSSAVVKQFFTHYGHPKRSRWREIVSVLLVYCFVLYFPAGLLALLWMDPTIQYLWLGYQVYCILAMHIMRVFGLSGKGRTEEYVAQALEQGKQVWLSGRNGQAVSAVLVWMIVARAKEGQDQTKKIINAHTDRKNIVTPLR